MCARIAVSGRKAPRVKLSSHTKVIALCALAEAEFAGVRAAFQKLAALIPAGQYYRYCDHWSRTSQQLCFAAAFLVYLKSCVVMDASASAQLITVDQLQALTGGRAARLLGSSNLVLLTLDILASL